MTLARRARTLVFALTAVGALSVAGAIHASDITPSVVAVRVSSEQSPNVGRNSIDGSLATRWSANGDGQWIDYDLGTTQHIGNVTVAFYLGDTRAARFDLQVGNGTTFTTKWSGSSSGTSTALQSYPVNGDARFLRLVGHGTTAGTWNSVTELHIFNGGIVGTPTPTPGGTPTPTPRATPTPPPTGTGNFPARFAAPYVETWNDNNLVSLSNGTGNKFWTLAFVITQGSCNPSWNGDTSLTGNGYGSYITNLRGIGGDVIVSFGGASGIELGDTCGTVSSLQAAYQKVISQFKLTWIDLDIEGAPIAATANIDRRNQALHNLQAANPSLRVSYTLAVDRSGLPAEQMNLLRNAQSRGVRVDVVNIMAMDYGPCYTDMGQAAIDAAAATRNQLASLGLSAKVGVTPMIGVNDVTCETFTTSNAQQLVSYANANSYIRLLAYWAQGADPSHSYINVFKAFR
jgi:hypothetical protein